VIQQSIKNSQIAIISHAPNLYDKLSYFTVNEDTDEKKHY